MGIGITLLISVALLFGALWFFANIILFPRTYKPQSSFDEALENGHFTLEDYQSLPKQEITLQSPFGYNLFGIYVPYERNPDTRHTVIIAHGITVNLCWSLKYLWLFRSRGFNVLMIEHRNHGRSGGTNTTYGYYEKYDLKAWVDWVQLQCGDDCTIGTHGESMGAAIALQHAAIDERVSFVVADCPFTSAADEFAYRMKVEYHLPRNPILPIVSRISKLRTGFSFEDASPLEAVAKLHIPVLFIHGGADDYIPPAASQRLYDAKPGAKQIWIAPDSIHAHSFVDHRDEYNRQVGLFLDTNDLLPENTKADN